MKRVAAKISDAVVRWTVRDVGLVLVYHALDPDVRSRSRAVVQTLDPVTFAEHLEHLEDRYHVVRARLLAEAASRRRRGQRIPVAITFDDDLPSHGLAAHLLAERGLPATFFVTGASLESPCEFWWQTLQRAIDAGVHTKYLPASPKEASEAMYEMTTDAQRSLAAALDAELPEHVVTARFDAVALRQLVEMGFEVGFHTRDHIALTRLDSDALEQAVDSGVDAVAAAAGSRPTLFAYPFGDHDENVSDAVRRAGFEAAFTSQHRAHSSTWSPYEIGRMEPQDEDAGGFEFGLAGASFRFAASRCSPVRRRSHRHTNPGVER